LTLADFRSDDQRRRTLLLFHVLAVVVRANAVFETRRRSEGGRGRCKHFVPFLKSEARKRREEEQTNTESENNNSEEYE
jgi:hypothetical protein